MKNFAKKINLYFNLAYKLVRGDIAMQVLWQYLAIFAGILSFGIITKQLDVSSFGRLNYVLALLGIALAPFTTALKGFIKNKLATSVRSTELSFYLLFPGLLYVVTVNIFLAALFYTVFIVFSDSSLMNSLVLLLLLSVIFRSASILEPVYYKLKLGLVLQKILLLEKTLHLAIVAFILLIFQNQSLNILALSYVVVSFLSFVMMYGFMINTLHYPHKKASFGRIESSVIYGFLKKLSHKIFPYLISAFAIIIYLKIDVLMLKFYGFSFNSIGQYSFSATILTLILSINTIVANNYKFKWKNESSFYLLWRRLFFFVVLIWLLSIATVFLFVPWIYGEKLSDAPNYYFILSICFPVLFLGIPINIMQDNAGLAKQLAFKRVYGAFINVIANAFLIPVMGATGAAIATVLSFLYACLLYPLQDPNWRPIVKKIIFLPTTKEIP